MTDGLRGWLRNQPAWVKFQEINREGWAQAFRRSRIQRLILGTRPVRTASSGKVEVRVLTWRRDWINAIWTIKSFYHSSGTDLPLFIHDGGLEPGQLQTLASHFPDATVVTQDDANRRVEEILSRRGLKRCREYRSKNIATRKVFDFFLLSSAEQIISIDPDVIFFKRPAELLDQPHARNLYNKDMEFAYSMSLDELEAAFGLRPPPLINSGLSRVARDSMDFEKIEEWLSHPKLFGDKWVTEQTLHALVSARHGVETLPETYLVSTHPGLRPDLVCKHYPGFFRGLLYSEGMRHLVDRVGLLK